MADFETHLQLGLRWPYQTSFLNPEPLIHPPPMQASRAATKGAFYSNKMQREVRWDSELERDFYLRLEGLAPVMYYQEQPAAITYQATDGMRPYHPDVLISFLDGRSAMVEIKPTANLFTLSDFQKWQALIQHCERTGMGFFIGNHDYSLANLLRLQIDPHVTATLSRKVLRGPVLWEDLKELRSQLGQSAISFASAALHIPLAFERKPFRARQATTFEINVIRSVTSWFSTKPPSADPATPGRIAACSQVSDRYTERIKMTSAPNVGKRWTAEEEAFLIQRYEQTHDVVEIAKQLGRRPNGIIKRLVRLGIVA